MRRAIEDIDLLEIGGGTQMALGMRAAIDEVKKNLAPNRLNRVLVLTDGQTYEETACIDLANQNRDQMSFSAMGVGVEFNEKLLMRISQDSHGKYHFIGDPAEIPGIFEDELAGLRAVSVRNGRIEVTLAQGVQVREAFRASPEIYFARRAAGRRRPPDQLRDRRPGSQRSRLRADDPGAAAAQARTGANSAINLRYEVPGVGEQSLGRDLTVEYTLDRTLTGKVNGRVMNLVDQVSIAKMQSRAEEELKAGNVDRATRLFEQCDPGHSAPGQRQGDAGAGGPDGSGQEDPDAADQGGQDHAACRPRPWCAKPRCSIRML